MRMGMMGKWAIPVIVSILILGVIGLSQEADAVTITISDEASCEAIPGAFFNFVGNCMLNSDFTVNEGDTLIVENLQLFSLSGNDFTNFGTVELNGGTVGGQTGVLNWGSNGNIINECGGVINANGNDGFQSGSIFVGFGITMTNKGTINLFGGNGDQSGVLAIFSPSTSLNNHGNFNENPGTGSQSGIFFGSGIFNDGLPNLCSEEQAESLIEDVGALPLDNKDSTKLTESLDKIPCTDERL